MLAQEVFAVVIAVGRTHDRVDVVARRTLVVEGGATLVVELDKYDRAVDAIAEDALGPNLAGPAEVGLAEVPPDFVHAQLRMPGSQVARVSLDDVEEGQLLAGLQRRERQALVGQHDVVFERAGLLMPRRLIRRSD